MVSMARPDGDDSNLPKEPGNEVCDIINCVAIYYEKGASGKAYLTNNEFTHSVEFIISK